MNYNISGSGLGALAILLGLWSVFVTIFWMAVGWRAMRAHEKIAERVRDIGRSPERMEPREL